jgi:hypothetical protein
LDAVQNEYQQKEYHRQRRTKTLAALGKGNLVYQIRDGLGRETRPPVSHHHDLIKYFKAVDEGEGKIDR